SDRVPAVRAEAIELPALLEAVTRLSRLLPVGPVYLVDLRRHTQEARRFAAELHPVAGVQRVAVFQVARLPSVDAAPVLHEHAACARDLVPSRLQMRADRKRERQVVCRLDHQPVSEAVDALVVEETEAPNVTSGADRSGDPNQTVRRRHVEERALENAVVVAGSAAGGAVR